MRHSCLVHVRRCDMPLVCGFAAAPPVSRIVLEQSPWPLRVRCRHGECRYLHTIWRAGQVQVLCGDRQRPAAKHTTIQPTRSRTPGRAAHNGTISAVVTCTTTSRQNRKTEHKLNACGARCRTPASRQPCCRHGPASHRQPQLPTTSPSMMIRRSTGT